MVQSTKPCGSSFAGRSTGQGGLSRKLPPTSYHKPAESQSRSAHRPPRPGEVSCESFTVTGADGSKRGGMILFSHDGQRVFKSGVLFDDGEYNRKVKSTHLLHTPPAICLQQPIVEELAQRGCRIVEISVDDGSRYAVDFATLLRKGKSLERGFGPQVMLPLNCWTRTDKAQQMRLF